MATTTPNTGREASHEFYASCPEGFEAALADELRSFGLRQVRRLKGRVTFAGAPLDAYRACLWSRLASRVFVTLARFDCVTADDLYEGSRAIAWENVLAPGATIAISARGTSDELRNSHYSALRVKDALCDRLVEIAGRRPNVDVDDPDARILLTLRGDRASLHLDLSGDPLFKRLPREAIRPGAAHVLRPDYAALALTQLGWQQACSHAMACASDTAASTADDGTASVFPILVDACCAGGGIVLEAAQILADRAPGLERDNWGFKAWAEYDESAWLSLRKEALGRIDAARDRTARILATDISGDAVSCARRVLKASGLSDRVIFAQPDAQKIVRKLAIPAIGDTQIVGGIVIDTTEVPLTKLPRLLSLVTDLRTGAGAPFGEALVGKPVTVLTRDNVLEQALGTPPRSPVHHAEQRGGPAPHVRRTL